MAWFWNAAAGAADGEVESINIAEMPLLLSLEVKLSVRDNLKLLKLNNTDLLMQKFFR